MDNNIYGLIGVFLGAAISTIVPYFLENKRERKKTQHIQKKELYEAIAKTLYDICDKDYSSNDRLSDGLNFIKNELNKHRHLIRLYASKTVINEYKLLLDCKVGEFNQHGNKLIETLRLELQK